MNKGSQRLFNLSLLLGRVRPGQASTLRQLPQAAPLEAHLNFAIVNGPIRQDRPGQKSLTQVNRRQIRCC